MAGSLFWTSDSCLDAVLSWLHLVTSPGGVTELTKKPGLCLILELLHTQQLTVVWSFINRPTITRLKTSTDSRKQVRPISGHLEFASLGRLRPYNAYHHSSSSVYIRYSFHHLCEACCATLENCRCPPGCCRPFSIWWISLSLTFRSWIQICPC